MDDSRLGGRLYRVTGASSTSGEDLEITLRAFDEADASRQANRRGMFVSGCELTTGAGTFSRKVMSDPLVHKLLMELPQLGYRLRRLSEEDIAYLSNLARELGGISPEESAHVARLLSENRHLPRT